MDKVLSIVIPTYNMEKYLDKCLSSLIVSDEKMNGLEILVIIDGSKDKSSEIGHSYETKYPGTFRVIDKENGNYGSCVNRGLKEAKGKYIKILDADDYFETSNFERYIEFLEKTDADAIINDMCKVTEDEEVKLYFNFDFPSGIFKLSEVVGNAEKMWMHCVAYKAQNLRDINYKQTEGISYTDQEWIFLPMAISHNVAYFNDIIYRYLVGREGQTIDHKVWNKNFWQELKGLRVMFDEYAKYSHTLDDVQLNYMKRRLMTRTRECYTAYLVTFDSNDNYQLMVDFDKFLKKTNPEIYYSMDNLHFTKYHFVKAWRKNYPKNMFFIKLLKWIRGYSK